MDRKGRRKGFILSLSLMAVGTASIAITPGYDAIGALAPIIIVIGRLVQGFSSGVEIGGWSGFFSPIAAPGNRGFYCARPAGGPPIAVVPSRPMGAAPNSPLFPP